MNNATTKLDAKHAGHHGSGREAMPHLTDDGLTSHGSHESEFKDAECSPDLPATYAVKMTVAEWSEQQKLMAEYIPAITRDRKKAAEIQRKLIFPSYILKAFKKLMGADYIRKEGYNTVDADLVYGPGWLDEDDGGPISSFAEANKNKPGYGS